MYCEGSSSQSLANVIWGSAKIGTKHSDCITLARLTGVITIFHAGARLEEFQPQELSMVVWGVAKLYGRGKLNGSAYRQIKKDILCAAQSYKVGKFAGTRALDGGLQT